jgi:hypothetical protein
MRSDVRKQLVFEWEFNDRRFAFGWAFEECPAPLAAILMLAAGNFRELNVTLIVKLFKVENFKNDF